MADRIYRYRTQYRGPAAFCETKQKKSMAPHNPVSVLLHPQVTICSAGVIMKCLE